MKRPWVEHGTIRWPGMQGYQLRGITQAPSSKWKGSGSRLVYRDYDQNRFWVAPSWIAWLYRLLPNHANVNLTAWKTEPSHFLANFGAPTWNIGLLMNGRERNFPVPAIVVDLGTGFKHHYYLPWGVKLYCRMVNPSLMPSLFNRSKQ